MYYFYIDKVLLPIAPEKLQLKINNNNKTMILINNGEINILKDAKLTDISFDVLLPNSKYPFAMYNDGFKTPSYYLDKFEKLKISKKPFQFIVSRKMPTNKILFDTNMKVSLEDYKISEEAKQGFDIKVTINLKQYKEYSTKTMKIKIKQTKTKKTTKKKKVAQKTKKRQTTTKPKTKKYKVKRGDCLWNIAKKYYGKGSQYKKIYNANKDKIKNPNLIYPGQVLTIP